MSWHNNLGLMPKGVKKDQDNRSRKLCVCGGHNASNAKRNLNHHSTNYRLKYRSDKKFKSNFINQLFNLNFESNR